MLPFPMESYPPDWFLPVFGLLFAATVIILAPLGVWLVSINKRHELDSLPPDIGDFPSITWTLHRNAKLFGLLVIACILLTVLGVLLASAEWQSFALLPVLIAFPLLWVGVILQMAPVKCESCGARMKHYCEETMVGRSEAINIYHICLSCKTTHKERHVP